MKNLLKVAKNLAYKCMAFCAKVFVSQQGERTKTGMGVPIMDSHYVTQCVRLFFKLCEALKNNSVAGMFKKKKRGTCEAIAELNVNIIYLKNGINSPLLNDSCREEISGLIKKYEKELEEFLIKSKYLLPAEFWKVS